VARRFLETVKWHVCSEVEKESEVRKDGAQKNVSKDDVPYRRFFSEAGVINWKVYRPNKSQSHPCFLPRLFPQIGN